MIIAIDDAGIIVAINDDMTIDDQIMVAETTNPAISILSNSLRDYFINF